MGRGSSRMYLDRPIHLPYVSWQILQQQRIHQLDIYDLELESNLGYSGKGRYGFDDITLGYLGGGGPTLANQTVASIAAKDFYMGIFGVKPQASNFTSLTDPVPSFMQNLRAQSTIPSLSWAYTAGNQYRKQLLLGMKDVADIFRLERSLWKSGIGWL
jgi:hypothetical protein